MNKKCQYLGMHNTVFINSHGLHVKGQITSSRDMLSLAFHALNKNELLEVWGRMFYTFDIEGSKKRTSKIKTTVTNPDLETDYIILGGKTGTLTTGGDAYNLIALIQSKKTGDIMLGTTLGAVGKTATFKRFSALKQLADWAIEQNTNQNFTPLEEYVSDSGSIIFVPNHNPAYFNSYQPASDYSINEDKKIRPASLTKVMTAILTIENVPNLNETFTIKQSDIVGGSGPKMFEGDIINYYDALHLMMMPSSNNTAKAMARVIGRKIIEIRGYK